MDKSRLVKQKKQSGRPSCPVSMLESSDLFESELAKLDTDTTSVTMSADKEVLFRTYRMSKACGKKFLMDL